MSVIEDIFVHPKTCYKFKNKSVDDSTLHELYELTKWGATSFNSSPMRLKFLKSTEAKQRLSKLVSDDNVQKVIDAPVCAIIGMDTEFWKDLPKNYFREDAKKVNADAVSHGATGKGNDQIRFELGYYYHNPSIKIISPWREWDLSSRTSLVEYADKHGIEISKDKRGEQPFSVDENILHSSAEGKILEDPWQEAPEYVYSRSVSPEEAPDKPEEIFIEFKNGDAFSLNGNSLTPFQLLKSLNELGGKHGVGRVDLVENRYIGMKSRGVYETPGGTILYHAHRAIESLTLDKQAAHMKDEISPKYAELIYNGYWFSPEREMLQSMIDKSQQNVEGKVKLKLYKGNVIITGRESSMSLYNPNLATFESDDVYSQKDAEGFIKLNALRLREKK